jgi:hypothetical protein
MKANPNGAPLLRTQAAQALRQTLGPDGLVTPTKLNAWKNRYGEALKAIDEVSPGFSRSFDDAAKATEALGEAAKLRKGYVDQLTEGKLSRLMGAQSPEEVRRIVGGMLRAPESTGQFKTLLARLKGDPEAIEGLRRAAADWITTNLVNASARDTHGEPMLSGAKFDRVLRERPDTLKLLFGPEGVKVLQDIGEESARAERTATMKRTAVGSDTASYLEPIYKKTEQAREQGTGLEGGLTIGALLEGVRGGLKEAAMLYGSRVVLGQLRKYIASWRARGLEKVQDIYHEALLDPDFARQLAKEAITTESGKKISALHWLRRTSIALEANREAQNQFRQGHADGGAVKFDPEAHGARMVRLVSKIRNDLNSRTKPLLGVHDDVIAAALQIARQAVG